MFPTQSTYGFASVYPQPYIFGGNMLCSYTQDYPGVHSSTLGERYSPTPSSEVSPWAWQWNEGMRNQEGPFIHHSYTTSITRPQVQPTYAVDQAPSTFSRVVGGPVLSTNRPKIICPRPIHPLPKWIDMAEREDDEGGTTTEDEERSDLTPGPFDNDTDYEGGGWSDEEDYDNDFDVPRRFLPSFILSPDPEDLPTPFFPQSGNSTPSSHTLASLSPDACDLPQPRFDSDPCSLTSMVNSQSSIPGLNQPRPSRYDSFGSIVSPDPEDLPPPNFEVYDRFEVGGFKFPGPWDRHRDRLGGRDARGHAGESLWEVLTGGGGKVSGPGHRRGWPVWSRDK